MQLTTPSTPHTPTLPAQFSTATLGQSAVSGVESPAGMLMSSGLVGPSPAQGFFKATIDSYYSMYISAVMRMLLDKQFLC